MIVVIPCLDKECKPDSNASNWLPRQCPVCKAFAIIGHGRRRRQSHDQTQDWILVRRGYCKHCHHTLTVLPAGCVPGASYNLAARQQAMERLNEGMTVEQAAPDCQNQDRLADPATIRRRGWRRVESLVVSAALAWNFGGNTLLVVRPARRGCHLFHRRRSKKG